MVFKRRNKRSYLQIAQDTVYPRGGWGRAFSYLGYRVRRLPDQPHRIARGVAAGVFVSFSPLFGLHFIYAGLIALLLRGNVIAAMVATFVGNPITFPFIAAVSIYVGEHVLGLETTVPMSQIFGATSHAFGEVWVNLTNILTGQPTHWERLKVFFTGVFLPYYIGGLIPGVIAGAVSYYLTCPIVEAYQKRRAKMLRERLQARLKAKLAHDKALTTE
ncbi:DUF2062 domain-containing protein [Qingshengfaniella alkalisoli]|uniref:DUF2062 domain-containing protein n=1 Tax=Qingshengfaniella alkalisoli TaxID=2599296 RepID=A0A5B8I4S8_9RHOB|nr:DUF2062 domain-containing protein [Qingshengfaniella alkalisoli]QDY68189.1 DUF2062 domain-containing protein [Qingshengfaniella alkalisoli]